MASEETLQAITDLLTSLNKDWEQDFLPLCSNIFKRDIFRASQLTEEEAQKGFSFLQKSAGGSMTPEIILDRTGIDVTRVEQGDESAPLTPRRDHCLGSSQRHF